MSPLFFFVIPSYNVRMFLIEPTAQEVSRVRQLKVASLIITNQTIKGAVMKEIKFLGSEVYKKTGVHCILYVVGVPDTNKYVVDLHCENPQDGEWSHFRDSVLDEPDRVLRNTIYDLCVSLVKRTYLDGK